MATSVTEIAYPPIESQATTAFIEANVAEADRNGSIPDDFKKALAAALSLDDTDYSIDDLWHLYILGPIAQDTANHSPGNSAVARGKSAGAHLRHYYPPGFLRNKGNVNAFPGGSTPVVNPADIGDLTLQGTFDLGPASVFSGITFNEDGTAFYVVQDIGGTNYNVLRSPTLATAYTMVDLTNAGYTEVIDGDTDGAGRIRDCGWLNDGATLALVAFNDNEVHGFDHGGDPYEITSLVTYSEDDSTTAFVSGEQSPRALAVDPNGVHLITVSNQSGRNLTYGEMSTAHDLSSWTKTATFAPQFGDVVGVRFNNDGTMLYCVEFDTDRVYQYTLLTPYDLGTAENATVADGFITSGALADASSIGVTATGEIWVVGGHATVDTATVEVWA